MKVVRDDGTEIDLGTTEDAPTIGITDFSRRVTDDFGITTVVERGFSRRMSVKLALPFGQADIVQQQLADLRATPALWVADDRFASLSVRGFYKDFSLDLNVPPLSFCTLTVEGLAETTVVADAGGDPAPDGVPSTLRLIQPVAVTDAVLTASSVAETDHAEWAAGAIYPIGARVMKAATHRVYESAADGNVGNDPAGLSGKWLDIGATNRWAMFDQALGSETMADAAIVLTLDAGAADALALLDVGASVIRVEADGYDRTQAVGVGAVTFFDLPDGPVVVTIAGDGPVTVGTLLIGQLVALGVTEASPTAGINDYSRKEIDDFGAVTVVQRSWAKRMAVNAMIRSDAVDVVANRIAAVRARPALWIGDDTLDSLTVYGFFKDFSIAIGERVSKLSLTVEGLSKAAKILPSGAGAPGKDGEDGRDGIDGVDGKDGLSAPLVRTQWSIDGSTNWHDNYFGADRYYRQSNDGGATWGPAVLGVGEDGADGPYLDSQFVRSSTVPVGPPSEWYDGPTQAAIRDRYFADHRDDYFTGDAFMRCEPGDVYQLDGYINATASNHPCQIGLNFRLTDGTLIWLAVASYPAGSAGFYNGTITVPANATRMRPWANINGFGDFGAFSYHFTLLNPPPLWLSTIRRNGDGTPAGSWSAPVRISGSDGKDGADGRNGTDGAPGANGADGRTTYVHYAYADSPNGQVNFTVDQPGGRSFVGTYTDFIAVDSGTASDYVWTAYKGPPAFGLTGSGDTFVGGNSLIKQGSGGWDTGGGYSTEGYRGGVQCSFVAGQGSGADIMAGLNSDPAANNSYDTIDYAWYLAGDGNAYIYESGAHVGGGIPGYGLGTFQIVYDNQTIRYIYNGFEYRKIAVAADQLLYLDAAVAGPPGTRLDAISYAAAGAAGKDGKDGIPGTDGTNGSPGRDGTNGVNGSNGADGLPSFVHFAYANSPDGTADFTIGAPEGRAYIGTYVDHTAADSPFPSSYSWTRLRGIDGSNGIPGAPGADGRPSYIHTAYANSADGTVDFHLFDATGRTYLGVYVDFVQADSPEPGDYVWSLIRGDDGTSPFALDLGSYVVVVNATYNGVTKAGQLPRNVAVSVKQGTTDMLGAVAIGVSTSSGIAASYGNGIVSITQINADGYVEVSATRDGINLVAPKRIAVSRNLDAPPPQTATGQTIKGANGNPDSTSFLAFPSGLIATVAVPASGQMPILVYADYSVVANYSVANQTYAAQFKVVYRPAGGGGAWSDLTPGISGTTASWSRSTEEYETGEASYSQNVSMPGGATFEFALMIRKLAGNAGAQGFDATMRIGV
ncbi:hypothetical protein [Sphingomonas sp. CFBP 13720]|uniref:hypothetical protein n=1 Tax=Sphingomonas sp. CFBP 13720 TaxID=2775302 RepID=UPI00177B2E0F|nr:hypothetical protein [Sphingomonas sp. CFBP 13720]MBD8677921.1 hypothetical protein [Sphingomonas sp. CFBP 13720]